jgi:prefoldin subunit 5
MSGSTPDQIADIDAAINSVQAYIDTLKSVLLTASGSGDSAAATALECRYLDANSLEEKLIGLLTTTDVTGLEAAVQSINNTTSVLQQQKTQIDNLVKSVSQAATVIGDIAAIAGAIAKLVATVP